MSQTTVCSIFNFLNFLTSVNPPKLNTTKRDRVHVRIACSQSHQYSKPREDTDLNVNRFGLAVRRQAGKQKGLGSIPFRLSFLFKKVVVCGQSCDFVPYS